MVLGRWINHPAICWKNEEANSNLHMAKRCRRGWDLDSQTLSLAACTKFLPPSASPCYYSTLINSDTGKHMLEESGVPQIMADNPTVRHTPIGGGGGTKKTLPRSRRRERMATNEQAGNWGLLVMGLSYKRF